jgi:hypothetical protein
LSDGATCPFPQSCSTFSQPGTFFIQEAAAQAYATFQNVASSLDSNIILNFLNLDNMVSAIGADKLDQDAIDPHATIANIGAGFSIAGAAIGIVPGGAGAGAAVSIIGAILPAVLPAATGDAVADLTNDVQGQLSGFLGHIFSEASSSLASLTATVFGGANTDSTTLPSGLLTTEDGETTPIGQFFAGGKWLPENNDQGDFSTVAPIFEGMYKNIQTSMVGFLLKSLQFYIYAQTDANSGDCLKGAIGTRFINNICYSLRSNAGGNTPTQAISALGSFNTTIDDIYTSSAACGANGKIDVTNIPSDGSFPPCFYNLPVLSGPQNICNAFRTTGQIFGADAATIDDLVQTCGCPFNGQMILTQAPDGSTFPGC